MFGYIKKTEVLRIIEQGQEDLRNKETDIIVNIPRPKTRSEKRDYLESINKLKGGVYFLECLKKHFK